MILLQPDLILQGKVTDLQSRLRVSHKATCLQVNGAIFSWNLFLKECFKKQS